MVACLVARVDREGGLTTHDNDLTTYARSLTTVSAAVNRRGAARTTSRSVCHPGSPRLGLLVAKRDRLAHDTLLAATIERLVERDGAAVRSAEGLGDGDAPEAVLMGRIVDAFAEYERLVIKARTRAALALKKSRSERISREPRYG